MTYSTVLAAAPMGSRIGITAARRGTVQASITVAPKAWRQAVGRLRRADADAWGGHLDLTLFETDRLALRDLGAEQREVIEALLGASRRERNGVTSWDHSLLAPDVLRAGAAEAVGTGEVENSGTGEGSATVDVLRLFDRVQLLRGDSDDLITHEMRSPLHRPLLYKRYLDVVAGVLHVVRPAYRTVTELRSTVRGRLDPATVVDVLAGRASRVRCTFSELSLSTPLLEVIVTALEWIADGRGGRSPFVEEYGDRWLRHEAVTLRRALEAVPAAAPAAALRRGRRIRLGRLDQAWSSALRLALLVLAEVELTAAARGEATLDAVELSVPTEKLWERIVTAALEESGFDDVYPEGRQPAGIAEDPWLPFPKALMQSVAGSSTRPDNIAATAGTLLVFDAKYKTVTEAPGRADQYQMFAYSHLVQRLDAQVSAVVLVYPVERVTDTWRRGRDHPLSPVRLYAVGVPFPDPADLVGPAWPRYLRRSGGALADAVGALPLSAAG